MSRRGDPKKVWHRGRGRRRSWGLFEWGRVVVMGGAALLVVGYALWLVVFQPMFAAPVTSWSVLLPLVAR